MSKFTCAKCIFERLCVYIMHKSKYSYIYTYVYTSVNYADAKEHKHTSANKYP